MRADPVIVTITLNGMPWLICGPTDRADLTTFMASAEHGPYMRAREADAAEVAKWEAELQRRVDQGLSTDTLFGIDAK